MTAMPEWIRRVVDASVRRAWIVVLAAAALTAGGLYYARGHLAIDTDTDNLFSPSLPWRQDAIEFDRHFPQFNNLIVAVVRGDTPEEAEETASALAQKLSADRGHFRDASLAGGGEFFRRDGLLLLPLDDFHKLLDSIYAAQALLGPLAADPSARGLFGTLGLVAEGVRVAKADLSKYAAGLNAVKQSLDAAASGRPVPLSWRRLLASDVSFGDDTIQFVLAHPVMDQGALQPGLEATRSLERIAAALPDVAAGRARVGYTGSVPLDDVQFGSITDGMALSTSVSLALLCVWLFLAVGSVRLIAPIFLTLAVGLGLTVAFASLAIGRLNLISVAFAILFVGLAIDFAIQFSVRLRDVKHRLGDLAASLSETAREAGPQIAVAAAATACGFLAFAPTAFVGVAELGIIAGVGMLVAFVCTITVLPALLWLFRPRSEGKEVALPFGAALDGALARARRPLLAACALLALAGLVAALRLPFDANPLHTKDPDSEPMRVLNSLMDQPATNPFRIDVLAPDPDAARSLGERLGELPEVSMVISGTDFLPADQSEKLDELAQARDLLATSIESDAPAKPPTAAEIRQSMREARASIAASASDLPADSPLRGIADSLQRLDASNDAGLLAMNAALTRFLPRALSGLNESLQAEPITLANLPDDVRRDWFLPDGRVRLQVLPTAAAQDPQGLQRFVDAVRAVAPNAGGPAVTITASAATILRSFEQAALFATVAIAAILLLTLRRLRDAGLVLAALLMSGLLTALLMGLARQPLNYANIIALPLLLGVGVSFNVYFVMNWRAGLREFLGSATARAILFSALTTGTAFGELAVSHDLGMSSMGTVLLLSLAAVLLATFAFLPALLYSLTPPERRAS